VPGVKPETDHTDVVIYQPYINTRKYHVTSNQY